MASMNVRVAIPPNPGLNPAQMGVSTNSEGGPTGAEIALVAFSTGGQSKTRSNEKRERSRARRVWRAAGLFERPSCSHCYGAVFPRAQQAAKGIRTQTICGNRLLLSAMRFTSAMIHSTFVESLFLM